MSRIGKKPIIIDKEVKVLVNGDTVNVEGPQGKLNLIIHSDIKIVITDNKLFVEGKSSDLAKNIRGLFRSLLQNAITGVKTPWIKTLELVGVGYRAQTTERELILNVGFSHPIKVVAPADISFKVVENKIIVSGVDKQKVGDIAASIRRIKKPEPYKGKGIRFEGEYIRKKLGKAAKAVGAAGAK